MKHLYIFSGLGADERVFDLIDFSGYHTTFISWEIPVKNETISAYASRLAKQVRTDRPVLIGLSFGGMIAVEVSKLIDVEQVILIASVKCRKEIPSYYRFLAILRLQQLIPASVFLKSNMLTQWLFGTHSAHDKQLLANILRDTSPVFFKWAMEQIPNWTQETILPYITHIHGTDDHIFPIKCVTCDVQIEGGGHFMTVNKAEEMTGILRKVIGEGKK